MRRLVAELLAGVMLMSSPAVAVAADGRHDSSADRAARLATPGGSTGPLARAAVREVQRLARLQQAPADAPRPTERREHRNWIARHPVLFGTAVGFGAGCLVGFAAGDDGVLDDFTAGSNAVILGGALAGIGAVVGLVVGLASGRPEGGPEK